MDNYSIYMPSYTIGADAYKKLGKICRAYGKSAVIIGGEKALKAAGADIKAEAKAGSIEILDTIIYGKEASYENVSKLEALEEVKNADMLFAVGGGKALDTVKCMGDRLGKPVFTFPTIASNCAAVTSVSIMYNQDGSVIGPYFFAKPPVHAFISVKVIAEAPVKYMWAGMGDTYAKYYEASLSSRDEQVPHYFGLGCNISRMCKEPVLEYGIKALESNKAGSPSYELEQTVLAIIVTTGMASIFLTAEHTVDYNSGLAHAIFYALTVYPQIEEKHLHGEVVGFGILLLLLTDGQKEEFEKLYAFHKKAGLPVRLSDIDITCEEMMRLIPVITQMKDIAHWPYRVTQESLKNSIDYIESL